MEWDKDTKGYLLAIAAAVIFLFLGNRIASNGSKVFGRESGATVLPAKVDLVIARDSQPFTLDGREMEHVTIYFEATAKGGGRRGQTMMVQQVNDPLMALQLKDVQQGDRVMICLTDNIYGEEGKIWVMQEYDRTLALSVLGIVFLLTLLIFGGKKGLGTIFSLVFTCCAIFLVFVPAILSGHNIILWTWLTSFFIIAVSLVLVNGIGAKSLAAGAGCIGGLVLAGLLFRFMDLFLKLTGMIDEDAVYLTMLESTKPIDLKSIVFASIIIGVLGASLDVGVSIASSLSEMQRSSPAMGKMELFSSGMNIGRDILCTMTNTLILVYIGSSLSLTLLLVVYSNSFLELINREAIVVEILQALIGSMGLLFTIPLTSACYALMVPAQKEHGAYL